MDETAPVGFQRVQYTTTIKSSADEAALRTLVETVESHCPMLDTLVRPIEVKGEINVNGVKI